jgi:hypothetical protein
MTERLTDEQLQALINGCDGVTPGPYFVPETNPGAVCKNGRFSAVALASDRVAERNDRDAPHFARCDPDAILALATEARESRSRIAELEAELKRKDEALAGIEEYWNGEPSDGAMLDALDVIVARARAELGWEG